MGEDYYPFQRHGIAQMWDRFIAQDWDSLLLADEPGLGKTVQAIGMMNLLAQKFNKKLSVLIVCPNTLKLLWAEHLNKWLSYEKPSIGIGGAREFPDRRIVILNYDNLTKWGHEITGRHWDLLVVDEAHMVKNNKAQRSKATYAIEADRRLFLTGSPIVNRPWELWAVISHLCPFMWKDWWQFIQLYCGATPANGMDSHGATNLKELHDRLRGTIMIRRLKREVLTELPPKTRKVIALDPADVLGSKQALEAERSAIGAQARVHEARQSAYMSRHSMSKEEFEKVMRALNEEQEAARGMEAKARHATALAKAPYVVSHVQDVLEESEKVVVFAHHLDVIGLIAQEFKDRCVTITGDTKIEDRESYRKRFQEDPKVRVAVLGITVGGLGITLTAASRCVFAELDWRPAVLSQAEDRLHRIGQKDAVLIEHILLKGSVDERMISSILEKQAVIDAALDNEGSKTVEPELEKPVSLEVLRKKESRYDRGLEAVDRLRAAAARNALAGKKNETMPKEEGA